MIIKLIRNILILIAIEIMCLVIPLLINSNIILIIGLLINSVLSFIVIKNVEKDYYKNYKEINSMLYMFCPFLGVFLIWVLCVHVIKNTIYTMLFSYYLLVYILVLVLNLIYICINHDKRKNLRHKR